jgi:polyisoprenoid-binding protein YceI
MLRTLFAATLSLAPMMAAAQDLPLPPAGTYTLDAGHTRVLFQVNHLGISNYIGLFTKMEGTLVFDPANPEAMTLTAKVDAASVETHYPDPAVDFNGVIAGPELLDAGQFPEAVFVSTGVVLTGDETAEVTGDLTLHGVTLPMTFEVRYNGGYGVTDFDPAGARVGFSVTGVLKRSAFGMGYGVPPEGTEFGVSDAVKVIIETEFTNKDAVKG